MKGHWPNFKAGAPPEEQEKLRLRFLALYFTEEPCCCGEAFHDALPLRDMFRHIYHALRCRVGLCVWESTP